MWLAYLLGTILQKASEFSRQKITLMNFTNNSLVLISIISLVLIYNKDA